MQKTEIDFQSLSLREYRDTYCKDLSLDVLRRAYGYTKNSHMPQNAVPTATVIYAEPFKTRELKQHGVIAEKRVNTVSVWDLQTETAVGQAELLRGEWDFHNRALCISRLGENYNCSLQSLLEFPVDTAIGLYAHNHRFVAVVNIEPEKEVICALPAVQEVADIIAKNALVHYPEYLSRQEAREYDLKHHNIVEGELPASIDFLLTQPVYFWGVADPGKIYPEARHVISVEDFLKSRGEALGSKLRIASVELFGDFKHL